MAAFQGDRRLKRRPLGQYRYVRLRWRVLFTVIDLVGGLVFGAAGRISGLLGRAVPRGSRPPLVERRARADKPPVAPGHSSPCSSRRDGPPRRILLIQLDHFGDAVITSVMLPLLRKACPAATIEVLAGPWNREVFQAMPQVDRVHVSRINRFSRPSGLGWIAATFWWGLKLRQRRFDLGIDVRGEFPHALILWLSGTRRRLGWACGGGGFLLTDSPRFAPHRPEVDSRLALLAELGIRPEGTQSPPLPRLKPDASVRARVRMRLSRLPEPRSGTRVVVHVGAGTRAKCWPVEYWRRLVAGLVGRGAQVVLVGGADERTIALRIAERQRRSCVADWTGQLSLSELAALTADSDLLVGADSGPAHLAAAVGTPVVVLFSGTNRVEQWQPRGRRVEVLREPVACSPCHRHECPLADHPCMRGLRPEQVLAAAGAVLGWRSRVPREDREELSGTA